MCTRSYGRLRRATPVNTRANLGEGSRRPSSQHLGDCTKIRQTNPATARAGGVTLDDDGYIHERSNAKSSPT